MPEYLAPGVFVEEVSFRAKSIEGVGTSTTAFVGLASRGPLAVGAGAVTPPLLTSFADYERYYGGVDDLSIGGNPAINFLAHAALAYFANGGGRLHVARVPGTGGAAAASGPVNAAPAPAPAPAAADAVAIRARTVGGATLPGRPGVNFSVRLVRESLATTKRLALRQRAGTLVMLGADAYVMGGIGQAPLVTTAANMNAWTLDPQGDPPNPNDAATVVSLGVEITAPNGLVAEYSGLGFHPRHPRYAGLVLGATPPIASEALTNPIVLDVGGNLTAFTLQSGLLGTANERIVALTGGTDGTGAAGETDYRNALNRLLALEDISIVAAPGASAFADIAAPVNQLLIGHAQARRAYRIAVLDPPPNLDVNGVRGVKNLLDTTYAALYYPWVRVSNPLAATDPSQPREISLPPSGFVTGIYARNDIQHGVHKAPANETVTGALGLQADVRYGEQEVLNPLGVNCIRLLPNRGIRVWGARTLSSDPEWKYVNVRRYFLYLESSIDRGTQWAVFESNGERLWANVRATVSDFLLNEWVSGALLGASPKEAFFVRCDRSTMTQNDLDNGRLICLVGVAALKPAEFVIFRIGQKTADSRD